MAATGSRCRVRVREKLFCVSAATADRLLRSDNDSAFINAHLLRYGEENHLTFTRNRANKKNDNCYVEQKNYTVVRKP
jgi:hypothetical protein